MILRHNVAYCTLQSVVQQLNAGDNTIDVSTTAKQNARIATESANFLAYTKRLIYEVSAIMSQKMNLVFVPYFLSQSYNRNYIAAHMRDATDAFHLDVHEPILQIDGVTWLGTAIDSSKFRLAHQGMYYPDIAIALDRTLSLGLPSTFADSVDITGIFGYHTNPPAMWLDTGYVLTDSPSIDATVTELNVTSNAGESFEILQYIRIDTEYMLITDVQGDKLIIERGVNGSTAAVHLESAAIEIYVPMRQVENEARRLAVRHWMLKGWPENAFVVTAEEAIEIDPNAVQKVVSPIYIMRAW